jgi:hypothetical protein
MRFMMLLKASKDSEAGMLPSAELISEMGKYNEELIRAGVLIDGAGLQASSKGARVRFVGNKRSVVDGPFAETKELLAGYWMIEVKSRADAIDWALRCPHPHPGEDAEIELRQVFETPDFPDAPPEVVDQERKFQAARAKRPKR